MQEVIISDANGNTRIGFSINKSSDGNQAKIQLYNGETSAHIDIDTGANSYVDWKTGAFRTYYGFCSVLIRCLYMMAF